jgi:hypothetical protein
MYNSRHLTTQDAGSCSPLIVVMQAFGVSMHTVAGQPSADVQQATANLSAAHLLYGVKLCLALEPANVARSAANASRDEQADFARRSETMLPSCGVAEHALLVRPTALEMVWHSRYSPHLLLICTHRLQRPDSTPLTRAACMAWCSCE